MPLFKVNFGVSGLRYESHEFLKHNLEGRYTTIFQNSREVKFKIPFGVKSHTNLPCLFQLQQDLIHYRFLLSVHVNEDAT